MKKEDLKLVDITLNKSDTCLTYVLKRMDLDENLRRDDERYTGINVS